MSSSGNTIYDVCVIGAGMIGSASAKYCAAGGVKTCLIGPQEPNVQDYASEDLFGAWFDETRISRQSDDDPSWSFLAAESIKRYRSIEKESGITFFDENGYLIICDEKGDEYIQKTMDTMNRLGLDYKILDNNQLQNKFPHMTIPDGVIGVYEERNAGTINPRRLVEAQRKLFEKHGGIWVKDIAVKVDRIQNTFRIQTKIGGIVESMKILACPGAFLNHFPILPSIKLDVRYRKSMGCRIRMDSGPLLDSLMNTMPSVLFLSKRSRLDNIFGVKNRRIEFEERVGGGLALSAWKPTRYPDGHVYFKTGYFTGFLHDAIYVNKHSQVNEWYRSRGSTENRKIAQQLAELAQEFIPGLNINHIEVDTCIHLETSNHRPYIGQLDQNYYTVVGGNGCAAKSSDELGRIGAELTMNDGKWPSQFLKAEDFRIQYQMGEAKAM